MSVTIEALAARLAENHDADEIASVVEAYEFSLLAHEGQLRESGDEFITHPLEVATILADLRLDFRTIEAALLHDTVEDCPGIELADVQRRFGAEVALLVDGITKLRKIEFDTYTEQQSESMRKMIIAMARDIRVILIKLADRLHNMRTLSALPQDKQIEKSRETMEIFAPLAHRLGISQIKWELEDLAFRYLDPVKYSMVAQMVHQSRAQRDEYAMQVMAEIQAVLDEHDITAEIQGRPKHLYSIYQKMIAKGKDFSEIYDLLGLRIVVDTIPDVYSVLGLVHSLYTPIPGRFKDYVAMPKFNMYQSLHTTVIGPAGNPLEVQIRTHEMHRTAEYGVAAHWRYKGHDDDFDERLSWLRQMLEWQTELEDPSEFMEELKIDLFQEEVFVFTPKGEVKSLKRGSTPLDFAFHIHTEIGIHYVGAKVNGEIVPRTYELQNGDRIEVLTQQSAAPTREWLDIVVTSSARSKIRSFLAREARKESRLLGEAGTTDESAPFVPAPKPAKKRKRQKGLAPRAEIAVRATDRLRLLQDVTMQVAGASVDIIESSSYAHPDGVVDMRFLFEMGDLTRLEALFDDLRRVPGVFEVRRVMSKDTPNATEPR
ncbi:MAG: bifunctional (p)ppGpp synthetase/guanosine-3',5'-bis(diphosphate) 3'-pyrophosphohydrolase [Coriobacteriia bacterium]|nr:bifunctional (p)ppGpp synthetase/guanosine-3',5'-bis(diphosphate) 3'-pyrophosphohydrolase [Coriobacteriia bacterium]